MNRIVPRRSFVHGVLLWFFFLLLNHFIAESTQFISDLNTLFLIPNPLPRLNASLRICNGFLWKNVSDSVSLG